MRGQWFFTVQWSENPLPLIVECCVQFSLQNLCESTWVPAHIWNNIAVWIGTLGLPPPQKLESLLNMIFTLSLKTYFMIVSIGLWQRNCHLKSSNVEVCAFWNFILVVERQVSLAVLSSVLRHILKLFHHIVSHQVGFFFITYI